MSVTTAQQRYMNRSIAIHDNGVKSLHASLLRRVLYHRDASLDWERYVDALICMPEHERVPRCDLLLFLERRFDERTFFGNVLDTAVFMTLADTMLIRLASGVICNAPCWDNNRAITWSLLHTSFSADIPLTARELRLNALTRGLRYPSYTDWDDVARAYEDCGHSYELVEALFGVEEVR